MIKQYNDAPNILPQISPEIIEVNKQHVLLAFESLFAKNCHETLFQWHYVAYKNGRLKKKLPFPSATEKSL